MKGDTIIRRVYDLLMSLVQSVQPDVRYRQDILQVLERAQAQEDARTSFTLLPVLACVAGGGEAAEAIPVAAAWRSLHMAAYLLDGVQDGDMPDASTATLARATNVATGLSALANLALLRTPASARHTLYEDFQKTVLRTAGGQHVDVMLTGPPDLDTYFRLVGLKSGEPFALAVRSGGIVAGVSASVIDRYTTFGYNVGILMQMMDDWLDFTSSSSGGHGYPLPVVYACTVASPEEAAFLRDAWHHRDGRSLEVRERVERLGGHAYVMGEIARYTERALSALEGIEHPDVLRDWLLRVMGALHTNPTVALDFDQTALANSTR